MPNRSGHQAQAAVHRQPDGSYGTAGRPGCTGCTIAGPMRIDPVALRRNSLGELRGLAPSVARYPRCICAWRISTLDERICTRVIWRFASSCARNLRVAET